MTPMSDEEAALWEAEERARRVDPKLLVNILAEASGVKLSKRAESVLAQLRVSMKPDSIVKVNCRHILLTRGAGRRTLREIKEACVANGVRLSCMSESAACSCGTNVRTSSQDRAEWAIMVYGSDAQQELRFTMAAARARVARAAVTMLSSAASAFVDPSMGPVDAATMKAAFEELVARIGKPK